MSRSEEFEIGNKSEYRVVTRDKDGNALYLTPDVGAPQHTDYDSVSDALDHVGRTGMGWRYDFDSGEFLRRKISHHEISRINEQGLPYAQERYPAGWKRGDSR